MGMRALDRHITGNWGENAFVESPTCDICGEELTEDNQAEMYDPAHPYRDSVTCHAECGIAHRLEVA